MFRPSGIWIVVFASALQAAISARSNIELHNLEVEKSQNNASVQGEPGCYCSQVKGPDECEDNKYPTDPERIDGPRFYHSAGLQKPLCCKREETGLINQIFGIGLTFHKQPDMSLCDSETTAVPSASCCHVLIKPEMGIRVTSAYARFEKKVPTYYGAVKYSKTKALVQLSDITGAVDFDGTELSSEDAQSFLKRTFKKEGGSELETLYCAEDVRSLVKDTSSECKLRKNPPKECCCLSMTLEAAGRCLPVEGAPQEDHGVIELDATFTESRVNGYIETTYHQKGRPEEPETAESVTMADPEIGDSFDFKWLRMQLQWTEECVEPKMMKTVESYKDSKQEKYTTSKLERFGTTTRVKRETHDKTVWVTKYRQATKRMCGRSKWTRRCPAGTTLYSRVVPKGQCFSKGTGLVAGPSFTYNCPSDYTNSASSEKCVCEGCDE